MAPGPAAVSPSWTGASRQVPTISAAVVSSGVSGAAWTAWSRAAGATNRSPSANRPRVFAMRCPPGGLDSPRPWEVPGSPVGIWQACSSAGPDRGAAGVGFGRICRASAPTPLVEQAELQRLQLVGPHGSQIGFTIRAELDLGGLAKGADRLAQPLFMT